MNFCAMGRMIKTFLLSLALWSSLCGAEVFFIVTADLHGNLDKFSRLAPAIRAYPEAVKADAGDLFQGNYAVNEAQGIPVLDALNMLGYEIIVLGNHDLEYPLRVMQRWQAHFSGKILGGQWGLRGLKLPGFTVVERHGIRIGVIALGDVGLKKRTPFWQDLSYHDEVKTVRVAVDELKKFHCHAMVLIAHAGVGNFGLFNRLLRDVPEIDAVIGAHSHKSVPGRRIRGKLAVQPDSHSESAVLLRMTFDREKKLKFIRSELLRPADERDEAVMALKNSAEAQSMARGSELLGKVESMEKFGTFAARSIRQAVGADVAFFRCEGADFTGELTRKKLYEKLPFGNRIVKVAIDREALMRFIKKRRRKNKKFFISGSPDKERVILAVSDFFWLKESDLHHWKSCVSGKFERDVIIEALEKAGETPL